MQPQKKIEQVSTDEWCQATESVLEELAEVINSISEPRWLTKNDSLKIECLRERIQNLNYTLNI
jgi:hypothetical protein